MEWWNIWQLQWSWFSGRLCSVGLWRSSDCQQGEVTATSPTVIFQGGIIWFVCGRQTIRVERNPDKVWVLSVQLTVLQLWLQQDFNGLAPVITMARGIMFWVVHPMIVHDAITWRKLDTNNQWVNFSSFSFGHLCLYKYVQKRWTRLDMCLIDTGNTH